MKNLHRRAFSLLSAETVFIQAQFFVRLYFSLQPCKSRLTAKEKSPNEYGILRLFGQQKLIRLYRKSGAKTKSDFVRARLLSEAFKVITQDPAKEPYLEKLSEIVAIIHKIGVLYNYTVKVLNTYHSVATAQRMLGKLETYSQLLIRLQHQVVQLTKSLDLHQ